MKEVSVRPLLQRSAREFIKRGLLEKAKQIAEGEGLAVAYQ